jgi:methyltransferase (TIGR00027 family)
LDSPPWILEDRVAGLLLTDDAIEELERPLRDWPSDVLTGFRVQHVVRTRVAEDAAVAGLDQGRTSYVLLGAGADTFAWRHPDASRFTILEYDLASTQRWKRDALRRVGLTEPTNVRFSPIDLTTEALCDLPRQATWNWLGVTMYLPADAMMRTLRSIAACGANTTLVVNFVLPADERDDLAQETATRAEALVSSVGEPLVATYGRQAAHDALRSAGFGTVEILDAKTLAGHYLNRRRDLHHPGSTIIAIAST